MSLSVEKAFQFTSTGEIRFEECQLGLTDYSMAAKAKKVLFQNCTFEKPTKNAFMDFVGQDNSSE